MSAYLIEDNVELLRSAIHLIQQLDDDDYRKKQLSAQRSGIGSHLRHVLDHYQCFLDGLEPGRVDYDQRQRLEKVETSCSFSIKLMTDFIGKLNETSRYATDYPLEIKMDCGTNQSSEDDGICRSSFGRELQFLVSHTIHHFAMISIFCQLMNIEVPSDFGVEPSTLKHQSSVFHN
jgi:uncharacterized damage-inducible protein DinB